MSATLDQLRSYPSRAANLRSIADQQSRTLRTAVRGERHPQRPAPRSAAQPVAPEEPQPARTIAELNAQLARLPECQYALIRKDGGITFLQLRKIGVGRCLIVQLHGAPGQFRHQTLSLRLQAFAALHIAEDPAGAAKRFADLAGECARCHSPLTREDSRRIGLGPDCRKYFGL